MQMLNQMDPRLYLEARRKQGELWTTVLDAIESAWERAKAPPWTVDIRISIDDVLEDLAHGRD